MVDCSRGVNLRREPRIDVESVMIALATPVAVSAIPSRRKGNPLTQELPPPVRALRVHAESNVCEALITQRPTATVTMHKIKVTALFMTLVYHHKGSQSWQ
jgi:hypothetical protein